MSAAEPCGRWSRLAVAAFAVAASTACSAAPSASARELADANDIGLTRSANDESERELLRALPRLPSGSTQPVGDALVLAEAPYTSASGRTCRAAQLTRKRSPTARHLLACSDGGPWFFVPDVFGGDGSAE